MEKTDDGRIVLTEDELAEHQANGYLHGYRAAQTDREEGTAEPGVIPQTNNQGGEAQSRTAFLRDVLQNGK